MRPLWWIPLNNWLADRITRVGDWLSTQGWAMQRCRDCGRPILGPACKNLGGTDAT